MLQNNIDNKKQTLKNFDDSMKLLLTESIKFFPVSSVNRIRRKYKALNILRKDGSLKYFMNELIPFQPIIQENGWTLQQQCLQMTFRMTMSTGSMHPTPKLSESLRLVPTDCPAEVVKCISEN